MAFQFKQFSVEDTQSTMRVGTDAVLLGSWCNLSGTNHVLDIGTGCGILALMAAQKCNAAISAIDIDLPSCNQAEYNFKNSPWSNRIHCYHEDLEHFSEQYRQSGQFTPFGHIVTNPPYFSKSHKSPAAKRNMARHNDSLPLSALITHASLLLAPGGKLSIVFPHTEIESLISLSTAKNLYPTRQLNVKPSHTKKANRVLMEFTEGFSSNAIKCVTDTLSIRNEEGRYTQEYLDLTADFYLYLAG